MSEAVARTERRDARSAMAKASDARPFRPYVYRGTGEDIYRGVAGPSPEWYRERAAENEDAPGPAPAPACLVAVPARTPVPALALAPALDWDWLDEARDRYQAAMAALDALSLAVPAPPAARCGQCGYLTTAAGHKVMCDD